MKNPIQIKKLRNLSVLLGSLGLASACVNPHTGMQEYYAALAAVDRQPMVRIVGSAEVPAMIYGELIEMHYPVDDPQQFQPARDQGLEVLGSVLNTGIMAGAAVYGVDRMSRAQQPTIVQQPPPVVIPPPDPIFVPPAP